jgi:hypothetical protein
MSINIFNILNQSPGNALITGRDPAALTGSGFIQANLSIKGAAREANILNEFQHGNIPDFLRHFIPVDITMGANTLTFLAMSDYLSIGTDSDYCRMPMNPLTAQAIANQYDCSLPTKRIVDLIWKGAANKLSPQPWGPPYDASMTNTYRIGIHNTTIQKQLGGRDHSTLTAGHKKDVVLTNALAPYNAGHRVAIYGWTQSNGVPIQGLNPRDHDDHYADYSHGIRLIANDVNLNGNSMRIKDIFMHPTLCYMLNDDGPLSFTSY